MSQQDTFEKLKHKLMADLRAQLRELDAYSFADVRNATKRIRLTEIRSNTVTSSVEFSDFVTGYIISPT